MRRRCVLRDGQLVLLRRGPTTYKTEMTVNGRTCYEKMRSDQECGSKDSDAAAPRAGIALLALGAAVAVAA